MENEQGKIHLIKEEKAMVSRPVEKLLDITEAYQAEYDERFLEHVGHSVGFLSNDDKV